MDIERAIRQGIDAARISGTGADGEYSEAHPLFRYWFAAVVKKATCRDLVDTRIRDHVMAECKRK